MANPFAFFRKKQKYWMAALVVLAIIAFVVTPALDSVMRGSAASSAASTTAVSWNGGKISIDQASRLQSRAALSINVLTRLADEVIKRGGTPKVPGFFPGPPVQLGFDTNTDYQSVLTTSLLSDYAAKKGVRFDDDSALSYLKAFTDGQISNADLKKIMSEVAGPALSTHDFYGFINDQLAQRAALQFVNRGMHSASLAAFWTPAQSWTDFAKFNQRAKIKAYPVFADEFIEKVDGTPSEIELLSIFEDGKERPALEQSADPGFLRLYQADLEIIGGNMNEFIDREVAKLTEEEILKTYNERVEAGLYKVAITEEDTVADEDAITEGNAGSDSPAGQEGESQNEPESSSEAPAGEADPATEESSDAMESAPESDKSATESPEGESPSGSENNPESSAAEKESPSGSNSNGGETPNAEAPNAEDSPSSDSPAKSEGVVPSGDVPNENSSGGDGSDGDSSGDVSFSVEFGSDAVVGTVATGADQAAVRLASFQKPGTEEPAVTQEDATPPESAPNPESQQPTPESSDEPATEKSETTQPAESTDQTEAPPAEMEIQPGIEISDAPVAEVASEEAMATDDVIADSEPTTPKTRVQTLDEVREELTREMVTAVARQNLLSKLQTARDEMTLYSQDRDLASMENAEEQGYVMPDPLDLQKMADELGLSYSRTGMVDFESVRKLAIGEASIQGYSVGEVMLSPALPLFTPQNATLLEDGVSSFMLWKVEEKESKVPEFEEARSEVEAAWKRLEARKLAESAAQAMVDQANELGENPWSAIVASDNQQLIIDPPSFTSMQSGMSFGRSPIRSTIDGIDSAGEEFMSKIFATQEGGFTVAWNEPKKICYVVQLENLLPNSEILKDTFVRVPVQPDSRMMASQDRMRVVQDWISGLEEELNIQWSPQLMNR